VKALHGGFALPKDVSVKISHSFRNVYVRFSLPIDAHQELMDALEDNLETLNGVNYVEIWRYEAVLHVATHVRKPEDVQFDVMEIALEPDGDIISQLRSAFDSYSIEGEE
jgi:hypothetical protein